MVNGEVVEVVSSFVYLGSTISSGSNSHSEVMRRIGFASSVMTASAGFGRSGI